MFVRFQNAYPPEAPTPGAQVIIDMPAGTRGLFLANYRLKDFKDLNEVLIARGARYEVVSREPAAPDDVAELNDRDYGNERVHLRLIAQDALPPTEVSMGSPAEADHRAQVAAAVGEPAFLSAKPKKPLALKPEFTGTFGSGRQVPQAQVEKKMQQVVEDVAAFFGTPKPEAHFDDGIATARALKPNETYRGSGVYETPMILYGQVMMDKARDPDMGVFPYRQVAHEAIHASVSGDHFTHGYAHEVEEGAAEILSLWYWHHRGQPLDERDATSHTDNAYEKIPGSPRWTEPGTETLAHSVTYREQVSDLMRRAAGVGGWDREAVMREVFNVMRGNHSARIAFRDATSPDTPPPPGVADTAPALIAWLLADEG
jgi:hypothetical protein